MNLSRAAVAEIVKILNTFYYFVIITDETETISVISLTLSTIDRLLSSKKI